jgi:anti-sigma-K factor RskA
MTEQPNVSHEEWDELAAGYALDALAPEDAQRLADHIATCARCRRNLDDFALVAAQLGSLADDEEPAPGWQRIRPAVLGPDGRRVEPVYGPEPDETSTLDSSQPVVPSPRPTPPLWRRPRVLAAAAAVLLIAAGALGWQLGTRSGRSPVTAAVAACERQPGCQVVRLHDAGTGGADRDRAAVLVDAGRASLVPLKLASAPDARMYVLWQMPRDGSPVAITTFRQTGQQTPSTPLIEDYGDTAAFAISLEPTGSAPRRPTDIVALGAAPA